MRDPNGTKYSLDFIKKWLNEAERQYCNRTGYSVKKSTSISTSNGIREYSLPSDCISEITVFYDGRPMGTIELQQTIHESGDKSGHVYAYYIENKKIGFEEIPTETKTVTLIYHSHGGAMDADGGYPIIPDEHQMLLVAYAAMMAATEGDDTRFAVFERIWERGLVLATADVVNLSPWPQAGQIQGPHLNPVTHDLDFEKYL